jgi:hypothetical protein
LPVSRQKSLKGIKTAASNVFSKRAPGGKFRKYNPGTTQK